MSEALALCGVFTLHDLVLSIDLYQAEFAIPLLEFSGRPWDLTVRLLFLLQTLNLPLTTFYLSTTKAHSKWKTVQVLVYYILSLLSVVV